MEQNSASKIVTLKDLWEVFVHRLWIILLAAVVAGGGFFAVDRISFTPQYACTFCARQTAQLPAMPAPTSPWP